MEPENNSSQPRPESQGSAQSPPRHLALASSRVPCWLSAAMPEGRISLSVLKYLLAHTGSYVPSLPLDDTQTLHDGD